MGMTKVYSSVVRFFFFERTSDPALTFKTLCEGRFLGFGFEPGSSKI
jgi:hypothetical protein